MCEPKRVALTSISTQNKNVKVANKEVVKAIRFQLKLPESNEKACPEYNYRDLLNSIEKKNKAKEIKKPPSTPNGINLNDPFDDDNDDDVKRIARQMEEKYGGMIVKPKRKGKKDDYADIGAGYDENDSFIDNTDAYDEMVPANVTTVHGGFYINSGALEFKQVSGSEEESSSSEEEDEDDNEEDENEANKTVKRKRIIEDSSESSSSEEEKDLEKEEKPKVEVNGKVKKRQSTDEKDPIAKKKKLEEPIKKKSITVKDLLREKKAELDISVSSIVPSDNENVVKDDIKNNVVTNSNTNVSKAVSDTIESVIIAGLNDKKPNESVVIDETSKESSSSNDIAVVSASSESESSRDGQSKPEEKSAEQKVESDSQRSQELIKLEETAVKLPDGISKEILDLISELKKAAVQSQVGKVKFFTGEVNILLLSLEHHCQKLGKSKRIIIYEHLAPFVKCKKDTLMRRTKNLLIDDERAKLKEPLKKLKQLIENLMPRAIRHYEKDMLKCKEEMSKVKENGEKPKRVPRKRFPVTEEARELLSQIITIKKRCFVLEGIRKETFEEHLHTFMTIGVVGLWPDGWMPIDTLMRYVKIIMDNGLKAKPPSSQDKPVMIDIKSSSCGAINLSPTKTDTSGVTVIPLPAKKAPSTTNVPKTSKPSVKSELSVNKLLNSEITVTATPTPAAAPTSEVKSVDLSNRTTQRSDSESDCQIIDITEPPQRKPGPKCKKYPESEKRPKLEEPSIKKEETSHSINNIMSKYPSKTNHESQNEITIKPIDKKKSDSVKPSQNESNKHVNSIEAHKGGFMSVADTHLRHDPLLKPPEAHTKHSGSSGPPEAHMKHSGPPEAHAKHSGPPEAHAKHSGPPEAHVKHSGHSEAHLKHSGPSEAHMKRSEAHMKHSNPSEAHLKRSSPSEAHIRHSEAHSKHSGLSEAHVRHSEAHMKHSTPSEAQMKLPEAHISHLVSEAHLRLSAPSEAHKKHSSSSDHHMKHSSSSDHHMKHSSSDYKHSSSDMRHSKSSEAHLKHPDRSDLNMKYPGLSEAHMKNFSVDSHMKSAKVSEASIRHSIEAQLKQSERHSNYPESYMRHSTTPENLTKHSISDLRHSMAHTPENLTNHRQTPENLTKYRQTPENLTKYSPDKRESPVKLENHNRRHEYRSHPGLDFRSSDAHRVRSGSNEVRMSETHRGHELNRSHSVNESVNYSYGGYEARSHSAQPKRSEYYQKSHDTEVDMEQVMKDLNTLQQMQEYSRTTDEIMSQSSSPVSVIAFNSSFSPTKSNQDKKFDNNFQDMFQKHEANVKGSQPSQNLIANNFKSNINSDFNLTRTGSLQNPYNKNYSQSNPGFSNVNSLPAKPTGTGNHADDIAMLSNFLYQYGYHNQSGSKQKSPP